MAIISKLTDKLRGMQTPPQLEALNAFMSIQEQERIKRSQRLYDYYTGDTDEIKKYLMKAMSQKQFKPETLAKMQLPHIDLVRKIINRTSLAYKVPAERYLMEPANEAYQELLKNSNINSQAKMWNRLAKLLDTVYVSPVLKEEHIDYEIYPPHLVTVVEDPDDYLKPLAVIYQTVKDNKTVFVYWSDTENYWIDKNGKRIPSQDNPEGINPYGILPFVPCRLKPLDNHWGEGDSVLVDLSEKISVLLCATYQNAIMQSHGVGVGTNLGQDKGELKIGPDWMIQVDGVMKDMVTPSLSFAQPSPATEACLKMIDWMIKMAAVERGLPASSVSIDVEAESGAAKAIDNFELMEIREDDIESLRIFEKKLFEVSIAVWNYHLQPQIPTESTFICDFEEIKAPVSEKDELEAKEKKYPLGLWTPVDDLIDEDEGVDAVKAKQLVIDNLTLKKEFDSINAVVEETDSLGKTPLALQQLALARTRAIEAGDTALAKELGQRISELSDSLQNKDK